MAAEIKAERVVAQSGVAKLSVVGIGMRSHAGVATRLFDCLGEGGVNIQLISTSEIKIAVVVDGADADRAAQLTHAAFGLARPAAAGFSPPTSW
jgi:aspartate kinase